MSPDFIAFAVMHCISIVCALITYLLLSWTRDDTSNTLTYTFIRSSCLAWIVVSLLIILPGIPYDFITTEYTEWICVIQGYSLSFFFIMEHTIMLLLSLHIYHLLVGMAVLQETNFSKYYIAMFLIPIMALVTGIVTAFVYTQEFSLTATLIEPRKPYCFFYNPPWFRIVSFAGWYLILALPGTYFSLRTTVFLLRNKVKNVPVIRSLIFSTLYLCLSCVSFIPTMVNIITHRESSRMEWSVSEIITCVPGIALLIFYGTSKSSLEVIRNALSMKQSESAV
ncbi:hypothetical protein MP638_006428 [Amoeboaphelidium occidentale]|nr:hypothetical protein MP638_006428 [Amoeboaphelidium occidentale]